MPHLNSQDLQILHNIKQKKFKYAFIDDYHGEEKLLRYGDDGIKEFESYVENTVLDPDYADEYFDRNDWECVYSGDRESPPEYDLKEDAEACSVILVLRNTADGVLLDFSEYTLQLFNNIEQFFDILKEYEIHVSDVFDNNVIDAYPESVLSELMCASDYGITMDELRNLFN